MSIRQLAEICGLSKSTVSAALLNKQGVADATRERVMRLAREMGFQPHGHARALARGKSGTIAVVPHHTAPPSLNKWSAMMLNGILQASADHGLEMLVVGQVPANAVPPVISQRSVDGAIFMQHPHDLVCDWLVEKEFPCVTVNVTPIDRIDSVNLDDAGGVRQAVQHLCDLGHRRVVYVNTHEQVHARYRTSIPARQGGFLKAVAELGLHACPGSESRPPVEERLAALVQDNAPTGIVCYNDDIAVQVILILARLGLRVPHDVNVVGIDDIDAAAYGLTSANVPFTEVGSRALEMLWARIDNRDKPVEHIELPETLRPRATTCPISECSARGSRG